LKLGNYFLFKAKVLAKRNITLVSLAVGNERVLFHINEHSFLPMKTKGNTYVNKNFLFYGRHVPQKKKKLHGTLTLTQCYAMTKSP